MLFSLFRIRKQLQYHWKIYALMIVEYMIGIGILTLCCNMLFSGEFAIEEFKKEIVSDVVTVSYGGGVNGQYRENAFPISDDRYQKLCEQFDGKLELLFFNYAAAYAYNESNKQEIIRNVFFMNDASYELLIGEDREKDIVYIGQNAYEELLEFYRSVDQNSYVNDTSEGMFYFDDPYFYLDQETKFRYQLLAPEVGERNIQYTAMGGYAAEGNLLLTDCIILPLKYETVVEHSGLLSTHSVLRVRVLNPDLRSSSLALLLKALSKDSIYQFSIADQVLAKQNAIQDLNLEFETWKWTAIGIIAVVFLSIVGIFTVFLSKRKRSAAISITYGATLKKCMAEWFLEILSVLMIGELLGSMLGTLLTMGETSSMYTIYLWGDSTLCTFVITILGAIVIFGLSVFGMHFRNPIYELHEL